MLFRSNLLRLNISKQKKQNTLTKWKVWIKIGILSKQDDLHDDIGSTLSKISMQSDIVKYGIDKQNTEKNSAENIPKLHD